MTTGNILKDNRQYLVGGSDGTASGIRPPQAYGLYVSRTWNGADYGSIIESEQVKDFRPFSLTQFPPGDIPPKAQASYVRPKGVLQKGVPIRKLPRALTEEHPYTLTAQSFNDSIVRTTRASYVKVRVDSSSLWARSGTALLTWGANDQLTLLSRLRDRVAGSDFNAGVFLGEGKESLRLISNSASRIAKSLRELRRGNLYGASRELTGIGKGFEKRRVGWRKFSRGERSTDQETASQWLELQYGWLPLLQDAEGGARFLAHHFSAPLHYVARCTQFRADSTLQTTSPTQFLFREKERRVQRWIKAILTEKDTVKLVGLTDPLSVAWELVPYSFVVDWFIPIGNYLQARALNQALTGKFVVSTLSRNRFRGLDYVPGGVPTDWKVLSDGGCSGAYVNFTREVVTNLTVPLPEVKSLGQITSWKRAANAVSLLLLQRPS